jgi:hypothetical protein
MQHGSFMDATSFLQIFHVVRSPPRNFIARFFFFFPQLLQILYSRLIDCSIQTLFLWFFFHTGQSFIGRQLQYARLHCSYNYGHAKQ